MDKIKDFLIETGDSYLKSFFEFCGEKLKEWSLDLTKDFDIKDIVKKSKEVKEKLLSIFNNKKIKGKPEYKNDSIFKQFNKNIVKSMINGILEENKIFENINNKVKKELNNFHLNNNSNVLNILLMGEEKKDIKIFLELISKVFKLYKDNDYENIINIEFNKYFSTIKKINIIEFNDKMNKDIDINCIWYIIDEDLNEINTKELKTNNKSGNIPIIYIGFKDKIEPEKIKLFNNPNNSDDNINIFHFGILFSYIIDIDQLNEEIEKNKIKSKEYFMRLIEKTTLNLLVIDNQTQLENKAKKVLDIILPRIDFEFGNKIKSLAVFNNQIIQIAFKKFLFEKNLPNSVQIKYKKMLKNYQKYMENREKSYFSEFLSKYGKYKKNKNGDKEEILNNKILEKMILYIKENTFECEDNEQEKKKNKEEVKVKVKKNKMMKVNEVRENDISAKMQIMFEDYFLKTSSIFINELIVNSIKEMIINQYNSGIIQYYIDIYKKEYIIISNEKKE